MNPIRTMVDPLPLSAAPGPASGPACPGCGKDIDALRAGHVAIFDGQFLYYCNASCKAAHLRQIAQYIGEDATTLDPPGVVARAGNGVESARVSYGANGVTSGVTSSPQAHGGAAFRETVPPLSADAAAKSVPPPPVKSVPPPPVEETAPSTMRSPMSSGEHPGVDVLTISRGEDAREVARTTPNDGALGALSIAGLLAGLLVPALGLAGEAGAVARLPLAVFAAAAFALRVLIAPRDPADSNPWLATLPVLGAAACAVAGAVLHGPHAVALASFAGVASAAALFGEIALAYARRDVDSARDRIAHALEASVRVVRGEETARVPPTQVKPGEHVVALADEVIGVDGIVAAGEATVVPWIDAPIEMKKAEGDSVVAGSLVLSGRLRLRTTWAGQDRAWAKLALSCASRVDVSSPIALVVRLVVERGAPLAALVVAAAAMMNDAPLLDVCAAACAAALALGARPIVGAVALVKARGQLGALEHGIVYKDARAFEKAGRTDVAVVCSRGTVLMGEPEIVALEPLGPENARLEVGRILSLAAGAETASTHPFAAAVLRAARARGQRPDNVRSATVHAGLGVTALASTGEHLAVGNRGLLLQEKVSVALADARISELEAQGRSVLLVALAGKLVGLVALQDGLRPGARAAVQRLLDARIEPVLLSGEARETCETLARAVDIDHIRPEVLPTDRGAEVRALGEGGHVVAVIGHPSTDDGALGAADVSIAMCSAGATPGEWAIALASDDVRDGALALGIAHATRDRSRVAMAIPLAPGAFALLLLSFGVAGPWIAALAITVGTLAALVHARR